MDGGNVNLTFSFTFYVNKTIHPPDRTGLVMIP